MNTYHKEDTYEFEDDGTMEDNVAQLEKEVVGYRIVDITKSTEIFGGMYNSVYGDVTVITLENGKQVLLRDSEDCCAYTSLDSFLVNYDKIDHIITGVGTTDGFQTWHIFADFGDVAKLQVSWSAGNPFYYGYGFYIEVRDID